MTSKNNQKKFAFSSLSIYRVADEEIGKLKNNRIHYTYQGGLKTNNDIQKKNRDLYQSHQINLKHPQNQKKSKEKDYRNKSVVKVQHYTNVNSYIEIEPKNQSKKNGLKASNVSKEKDKLSYNKKSVNTYKTKAMKKRNMGHIDRIIIDLVNDDEDNDTVKTESNYYKKEKFFKKYIINNNEENYNNNNESLTNKDNNIANKDGLQYALNMVENRWKNKYAESKENNISLLSNQIYRKKKEIESIVIKKDNKQDPVKEINFSILKERKIIKKQEDNNDINNNNIINRWNKNIQKENNKYFSLLKEINKNNFKYSEKDYIKDLTRNINIPPNNETAFYIINNDNFINESNKLDYKLVKPKNKNQLESELFSYYQEKKNNYLKNKDNNEELKINPIYILSDKQIKQFFEELNIDNKPRNKNEFYNTQLSIAKQTAIDYEIIEIFTPKNNNIDNNSNNAISKRSSVLSSYLRNEKTSEVNYGKEKKSSGDFRQYTPISMLNDKFHVYAVSRNIKYSVPQRQGFINFLSYNKGSFNYDKLKKNNFSLKIEWYEKDSYKNSKDTTKRNDESLDKKNENIIDYSKLSGVSNKSSNNSFKKK